jgi:hypothetical protein
MTKLTNEIDTGSSDLWVVGQSCKAGCDTRLPPYPLSTVNSTGLDVSLLYGDSGTGTYAHGVIGKGDVSLAKLQVPSQQFALINRTNAAVIESGASGIFGLGFPVNRFGFSHEQFGLISIALQRIMERDIRRPIPGHELDLPRTRHNFDAMEDIQEPTEPSVSKIRLPTISFSGFELFRLGYDAYRPPFRTCGRISVGQSLSVVFRHSTVSRAFDCDERD